MTKEPKMQGKCFAGVNRQMSVMIEVHSGIEMPSKITSLTRHEDVF
ncbi:hypothetical protein Bealeia1_02045 (plasmid) [Candidatus Bealeia paramacronuclearis]|uniref:Uncharacterized protein n=1 Tax=Candidatus Bealeia paramacronuclearis TaxID=1921001 RepID=A0ABZ2C705_9PROT